MNIEISSKEFVEAFGIFVREVEPNNWNEWDGHCEFELDGEIIYKTRGYYHSVNSASSEFLEEFVKRAFTNKGE